LTGLRGRGIRTLRAARPLPARDGGASQVIVVAVVGLAALMMISALTLPMMVGGSSALFAAGSGGLGGLGGSGCSGPAQQASSALQSKASGTAKNSIPADYLGWYQEIGRQYGVPWVILAGIGTVESDNGQSNAPGVHSGTNFAGAAGPMQIGVEGASGNNWGGAPVHPASEVVNGVATDETGNGIASVYDPPDAIAGAAKYLLQHGVQTNVSAAIFAYNHLQSYVQDVESYATAYAGGGYSVTAASSASTTTSCAQIAGTVISDSAAVPNQAVSTAVGFAEQQIGKPYLWGGTGPDAFDCSGLVMMAYQEVGVTIPRTAEEQWAWGPRIQPGHEEPGDLVFFAGSDGTAAAPGHVGLVIGGGKMIEAYAVGYPVRIVSYGTSSSPPGDQHPVGFTRPWAHAGVVLPAQPPGG
jgi:peptidoglycan DL-endopeptidase CwlO